MKTFRFFLWLLLLLGVRGEARALIIGMPGANWITQYGIGMCSAKYENFGTYLTWKELQIAPDHSVTVGRNEIICIAGHGEAGFIGGIAGPEIAQTIKGKVNLIPDNGNSIILMACSSAIPSPRGPSVMQAFQAIGGAWQTLPIAGTLGICVADRSRSGPLFQLVLQNPLPENGPNSFAGLLMRQNHLQSLIQENIDNCRRNHHGDLAIGQCLYDLKRPDGQAINKKFYIPFLDYITGAGCTQVPGVLPANHLPVKKKFP
ncbi:MAG: hypothetical protein JXR89_11770 [Deltaproteobacteria bacterium]|nr:hypothetical protein [Deltaproteobacteria bacterium]